MDVAEPALRCTLCGEVVLDPATPRTGVAIAAAETEHLRRQHGGVPAQREADESAAAETGG